MPKRKWIAVALAVLVSLVLLGVLLTKIDAADIGRTFRRIFLPALFAYGIFSLAALWLRAWRTRLLLRPRPIAWNSVFLVTVIRNAFEDLLPARIGSLSYIYLLNKTLGFPFEAAASTFVIAFVLDFLTLSPFLMTSLLFAGWKGSSASAPLLLGLAGAYFLFFLGLLWNIIPAMKIVVRLGERLLRFFKADRKPWARLSLAKLDLTIESLAGIRGRKALGPLALLSMAIRLFKYCSLFLLLLAVLRSYGYGLTDLNFWKVVLGITAAEMTSALPVKGLADFGTWESAWALAFGLMGFEAKYAILSGIGIHVITNLFEYGLGLAGIGLLAVRRKKTIL